MKIEGDYVIAFDKHEYYLRFSGQNMKAVDFMIVNEDYLYFIELKNFQQYQSQNNLDHDHLHALFVAKCDDSKQLIYMFFEFLMKDWFRRYFILKRRWFFMGDPQWKYWLMAYEHMQNDRVICLFHYE